MGLGVSGGGTFKLAGTSQQRCSMSFGLARVIHIDRLMPIVFESFRTSLRPGAPTAQRTAGYLPACGLDLTGRARPFSGTFAF